MDSTPTGYDWPEENDPTSLLVKLPDADPDLRQHYFTGQKEAVVQDNIDPRCAVFTQS